MLLPTGPKSKIDYTDLDAMRQVGNITHRVSPTQTLNVISADPSDNRILECAAAAQSDFIVTGDAKHILPLGSYAGIPIVRLTYFLEQLKPTV